MIPGLSLIAAPTAKAAVAGVVRHWRMILIAALVAFAGWQMLRVAWAREDLLDAQMKTAIALAAHEVTAASLERALAALDEQSARVRALAAEGVRRRAAAEVELARAREANQASAATIAGLRESAARSVPGDAAACPVSDALLMVEGL